MKLCTLALALATPYAASQEWADVPRTDGPLNEREVDAAHAADADRKASSSAPDLAARFDDWDARDAEGRWVLIERDLRQDPERVEGWIASARARATAALLTWLGMTQQYGGQKASEALHELGDPRWVALAAWRLGLQNSHAFGAEKRVLERDPALVHGWALSHRAALGEQRFQMLVDLTGASEPDPARASALAEPFDVEALIDVLHRAESAVAFGERRSAAADELYDHQVRRAMATLANCAAPVAGYPEALLAIARLPRSELAAPAARSFVQVAPDRVPAGELFALSANRERPATVREALFLGATYGPDPVVWLHLHALLDEPRELLWTTAVERLAELGDAFTLTRIDALEGRRDELLADQRERLATARIQIDERLAAQAEQDLLPDPARIAARADYAASLGHPLAPALRAFAAR